MQKYKWIIKADPEEDVVKKLTDELNLPEILSKILAQRGVCCFDEAKNYFRPKLENLYDPFLMMDMDKACDRVLEAIKTKQKILIYGDYDVDGTTSVAMMYSFLKSYTNEIDTYIPDRYTEGYGVSEKGINYAIDNNFQLIITLDCGIKASRQVAMAQNAGIDVIICDHHMPADMLPAAFAVLDPKRKDCHYPFKELSGCGVGFKLIQGLAKKMKIDEHEIHPLLDLVCISVAADIVPIEDENRILAAKGLEIINDAPRAGIMAMIDKFKSGFLNISDIVFGIAPKINAAGRIAHASYALDLLLAQDTDKAQELLYPILSQNNTRKELDNATHIEALHMLENENKKFTNVVFHPSWHKGILGIVASRIIETYYKPTVVFTQSGENLVASARSVKGFDLYAAIEHCADLLSQYGGHMYAAGLSMPKENLEAFRKRFDEYVQQNIKMSQTTPSIEIDAEINLNDINGKFVRILEQMSPFGPMNLNPVFLSRNIEVIEKPKVMGKDQNHLKLKVKQKNTREIFELTVFNATKDTSIFNSSFDMVYSIKMNYWRGKKQLQLVLEDAKKTEEV